MERRQSFTNNSAAMAPEDFGTRCTGSISPSIRQGPSTSPSSSAPNYTVFISHAGEDKVTIAIPLREKLMAHGITAFVDETDMQVGSAAADAMESAMETAQIAVVVLSPEFVARKWPMRELMCFLRRRERKAPGDPDIPLIIPFFYRLKIDEVYQEPRFDRLDKNGKSLYNKSRFLERMQNGEPEANIKKVKSSLRALHGIVGVRNDVEASNESLHIAYRRRETLLHRLCDKIQQAVETEPFARTANMRKRSRTVDQFHAHFNASEDISDLVFFWSHDDGATARSQEARLLEMIMDESQAMNRTIAVRGIAGVGKTSLMHGISSLDVVKQRFYDGVYHLSLGMDGTKRDLIDELSTIVERSGGPETAEELRRKEKIENVISGFQSWFEAKSCLFILDDICHSREIPESVIHELLTIHVGGKESRILLTTRSNRIASRADKCFPLEPRSALVHESRRILIQHAGIKPENEQDKKVVKQILRLCSGLPLLLAVAGKAVKALRLQHGHERCAAYHVYADRLLGTGQIMFTTSVAPYLEARLMISVHLAEQREQDLGFHVSLGLRAIHRRLSVLKKRSKVPMRVLKFLWELQSESQAAIIAGEFENVGLADVEFEKRGSRHVELLRLHESLHYFAVIETRKKREQRLGHEALLKGYGSRLPVSKGYREWWHASLEADGYIHGNLCRHLLTAGRTAELVNLLMSPQWAVRQIKINGPLALESDFALGIKAVRDGMTDVTDKERSEMEEVLRLISEAVTLSSGFIASNNVEIWFQLHGRLIRYAETYRVIREYVSWMEGDAPQPSVLCRNSFLGEPGGANTRIVSIDSPARCIVVLSDMERVACGSEYGEIIFVNVKRSEVEKRWIAHDDIIMAIAVGSDGGRIVSGSADMTAKVWEVGTCHCVATFTGHTDYVTNVAVTGDGKRAISVSHDGTTQVWDMETAHVLSKLFTSRQSSATCVAVLGDREEMVTGGSDNKLRLWNVTTGTEVSDTFDGHTRSVTCVAVTPDGRCLVSGSQDNTVRSWNVESHHQIGDSFKEHSDSPNCVAVSEYGCRIASSSRKMIRVWDSGSGKEVCDPQEGHTSLVTGVSFLGDVDCIVSCSLDGTVRMWDVRRKKSERSTDRHEDCVTGVAFAPDGKLLVSASYDHTLRVWNAISGRQVGDALKGHADLVNDVTVAPDGLSVVSVSDDKTVRLWDLKSQELKHTFCGHTDKVWCVAVTPQGDRAVTGSIDENVRVWNLVAKGDHFVLSGHNAEVWRVFITDDGLRVVSVDANGNIFVWELETRTILNRFRSTVFEGPRRYVLGLVGEATVNDDARFWIPLYGRQLVYGEQRNPVVLTTREGYVEQPGAKVLATMQVEVRCWALSPDKATISVGLYDGRVGFMHLKE